MSTDSLTATSYAVLGLLAIKPWTTYELAKQMDRTMNRFWPRARSRVYEEPKRLASLGLAKAAKDTVGRRPRTTYTITAKGRRALAAWLTRQGDPPVLECEQVLKVFFAENGSTTELRARLDELRAWTDAATEENIRVGRAYLDGKGEFPERVAVTILVGRFLDDFLETVDRWAAWARTVVDTWPDSPADATPAWHELEQTVEQSRARAARRTDGPPLVAQNSVPEPRLLRNGRNPA